MSKKNLRVDSITNELEGASLFFKQSSTSSTPLSKTEPELKSVPRSITEAVSKAPEIPSVTQPHDVDEIKIYQTI